MKLINALALRNLQQHLAFQLDKQNQKSNDLRLKHVRNMLDTIVGEQNQNFKPLKSSALTDSSTPATLYHSKNGSLMVRLAGVNLEFKTTVQDGFNGDNCVDVWMTYCVELNGRWTKNDELKAKVELFAAKAFNEEGVLVNPITHADNVLMSSLFDVQDIADTAKIRLVQVDIEYEHATAYKGRTDGKSMFNISKFTDYKTLPERIVCAVAHPLFDFPNRACAYKRAEKSEYIYHTGAYGL